MIGALACAWLLLAAPAAAQEDAGAALAVAAGLSCQPGGYEVVVRNDGEAALPEGTVIGWEVPFARSSGTLTLDKPLDPGQTVTLSAVLGSSYVSPRKPCIVRLPPP